MTRDQLNELYLKYLQRPPTLNDVAAFINKPYDMFEEELKRCEEYKNLQPSNNLLTDKIAILLSGHVRKNSIAKSLKKLEKYNYDIFVHTWDNFGLKGRETNLKDACLKNQVEYELKQIPNIKKCLIENNASYISNLPKPEHCYFNFSSPEPFIKSQLYSIFKSHELMEQYQKETGQNYRAVFKLRFDTDILTFNLNSKLLDDINNYDIIFTSDDNCHTHPDVGTGSGCYICNKMYYEYGLRNVHVFDHSNIICDFYAYGSEKAMKTYCSMHNVYEDYVKNYEQINFKSMENFKHLLKKTNTGYTLTSHNHSFFYFYCSYPERILRDLLKDYMAIKSLNVRCAPTR